MDPYPAPSNTEINWRLSLFCKGYAEHWAITGIIRVCFLIIFINPYPSDVVNIVSS
jgi:hypothetical protein